MAFISSGTTILDNGAFSVGLGGLVLLSEQTASASASISFTSGIDSTYDIYKFEFINIHPATNDITFQFNLSTNGGSTYVVTKTTTLFRATHGEDGSSGGLSYLPSSSLAQNTAYQALAQSVGNDNDQNIGGYLYLFNPSSTTYVKNFITNVNSTAHSDRTNNEFAAGYGNTTSAVNAINFKFSSGNIDAGTIKMYGIKGS